MMMLHENTRLVIVSAVSFYTINITQRNFDLPARNNNKIVRKVTDNFFWQKMKLFKCLFFQLSDLIIDIVYLRIVN